jgi:hypothetical protein
LTKHLDELKCNLIPDDAKIEVAPTIIETPIVITAPSLTRKPKAAKVKARMVKAKMTTKKSTLEKATSSLYDLENCHGPEKTLNLDLDLYQMEDY